MARRRSGKRRGSVVGTLVFAAALLVMWAASRLGLVSWGGGGEVDGGGGEVEGGDGKVESGGRRRC